MNHLQRILHTRLREADAALEPMNPYERRIIHSALQGDKFVSTKSEGEEPFRHVVVYLDREKAGNNRYSEHRYSDNNRYSR